MQLLQLRPPGPRKPLLTLTFACLACLVAIVIAVVPLTFDDTGAEGQPSAQVWVPETQQTVAGPFLTAWLATYGVERLGLPISGALLRGDRWVQWFEYGRLEIAQTSFEAATAADVQLAPIGRRVAEKLGYDAWLPEFLPKSAGGPEEQFFPETGHTLRLGFQRHYGRAGVAARLGLPISEEFSHGGVVYQHFEFGALSWAPGLDVQEVKLGTLDASLNGVLGAPQPQPADARVYRADRLIWLSDLLPGERWIEVDVNTFTLTAYVGEVAVLETVVSTGHEMAETPAGEFAIYLKYERQDMSGIGWNGQPYFEAAVPWAMYFFQDFAIHGSTWRTAYGYKDSQGCVVPPNEAAELLFEWADYGTRVVVYNDYW